MIVNGDIFRKFKTRLLLSALLFCLSTLFAVNTALAKGVVAGTNISNKVIVNYKIAGQSQTPIESSPTGNKVPGLGNGMDTSFVLL